MAYTNDREVKTQHNAMNERWQLTLVGRLRKAKQLLEGFEVSTGDLSKATVLSQTTHLVCFHLSFSVFRIFLITIYVKH